jgi:hypothetical protein
VRKFSHLLQSPTKLNDQHQKVGTIIIFSILVIIFFISAAVRFLNSQTGYFLQSSGKRVFINKKNGKLDQDWIIRSTGLLDWVTIENVETGRYLDSDSIGNVFTSTTSSSDFSKWRFSDQNIINVGTVNVLDIIGQQILISRPASGAIGQNWVRF